MSELLNRKVPEHIADSLQKWERNVRLLRLLQVILGTSGMIAALIVTTFTADLSAVTLKIASLISALCISLISAFDIGGKANASRAAWRHLSTAILRYRSIPESSIDNLIDSYAQAEAMIGGLNFRVHDKKTG